MARGSRAVFLGLLVLAGSAAATTVGDIRGKPLPGHPLEVNIPFTVDDARERACATANVRYGTAPMQRATLHVQGRGPKRNLLVTSRAKVTGEPVTISVRVGCGAKAVARKFVLGAPTGAAKSPAIGKPLARLAATDPLFPPAAPEAQESSEPKPDASALEELRKARGEAATALGQLDAARKELAAVLDVERRTQQTLINAEHKIQEAQSEVARMRLVLKWAGAALTLGAAGLIWWEVQRLALRRRTWRDRPQQEPTILASGEMPA